MGKGEVQQPKCFLLRDPSRAGTEGLPRGTGHGMPKPRTAKRSQKLHPKALLPGLSSVIARRAPAACGVLCLAHPRASRGVLGTPVPACHKGWQGAQGHTCQQTCVAAPKHPRMCCVSQLCPPPPPAPLRGCPPPELEPDSHFPMCFNLSLNKASSDTALPASLVPGGAASPARQTSAPRRHVAGRGWRQIISMTQFQRSWSAALPRVALSTASRVRASARRGLAAGEDPPLIKPPRPWVQRPGLQGP